MGGLERKRGRVREHPVRKTIGFRQKHLPITGNFYGFTLPPTTLNPNWRVQLEGYGGPDLDDNFFQLFSILFIV